ncbi:anoctamin-7-like [Mytilus californianus]|uniref:anoctamin-7-like n=1 Tax=Mytilus californianus TaxID=6549 RepID=UPI002247CD1A|nr:anoctamin-7-like [Mytilus californianus]
MDPMEEQALKRFDRVYTKLGQLSIPESKTIDIVLIHSTELLKGETKRQKQARDKLRVVFENKLRSEGFDIEETVINGEVYKNLHCSFKRLCIEAEETHLKMPLKNSMHIYPEEEKTNCFSKFVCNKFATDENNLNYISSRFMMERIHLFENYHDPSNFFRPAVRTLLVNHILINMNISNDVQKDDIILLDDNVDKEFFSRKKKNTDASFDKAIDRKIQILNFPYMTKLKVYTDYLICHEPSKDSQHYEEQFGSTLYKNSEDKHKRNKHLPPKDFRKDQRKVLYDDWKRVYKFQPLTNIRYYFGEKIAFYFAWKGLLMTTLWVPMFLGLVIFIYGIVRSARFSTDNSSTTNSTTSKVTEIFTVIKEACDNEITPFFALIICVWGTIFLKLWKRKSATLAHKWYVDEFEVTEPDRPKFYGTRFRKHPVTRNDDWYFSKKNKLRQYLLSGVTIVFMLCVVLASVTGVIVYRVAASVHFCPNMCALACFFVTSIVSTLLNAISILILSKLYGCMARKLTDWENHRTQTSYDDALIVKLFAFEFANNYASCFYIAFVKGRLGEDGIVGLGKTYTDNCEPNGNCMSELSFQIFILISLKPLPKFFQNVVWLWIKRLWRKRLQWCCKIKVEGVSEQLIFVEKEFRKPSLGDFTMEEYTEKIIQYGFLMLFATSLPLAPLIVLITNLIDIRVDAKRMLWWYKRPLAKIAQDIGIWFTILQFVNICGVISNGFLIGFTSSVVKHYDVYTRLWIVVAFEHTVVAIKLAIDYFIPDVPADVRSASKKSTHYMSNLLKKDRDQLKEDLSKLRIDADRCSPPQPLQSVNRDMEIEVQIADEEPGPSCRPSPKDMRKYRFKVEVKYTPIRKFKKKKKKHHHRHYNKGNYDFV